MKLTKTKLKQIIKEELENVLSEVEVTSNAPENKMNALEARITTNFSILEALNDKINRLHPNNKERMTNLSKGGAGAALYGPKQTTP